MSVYIGKRKGLRVCTDINPPVFPSRWCRWVGHFWSSEWGSTWKGSPQWKECERCGAKQEWYNHDSHEGAEALAALAAKETTT